MGRSTNGLINSVPSSTRICRKSRHVEILRINTIQYIHTIQYNTIQQIPTLAPPVLSSVTTHATFCGCSVIKLWRYHGLFSWSGVFRCRAVRGSHQERTAVFRLTRWLVTGLEVRLEGVPVLRCAGFVSDRFFLWAYNMLCCWFLIKFPGIKNIGSVVSSCDWDIKLV